MAEENFQRYYIHEAAKRGYEDQLEEVLATNKSEVHRKDTLGNTPLHWAASGGHYQATDLLIKRGADVNAVNNAGDTPLHRAAWKGGPKVCELLINAGAGPSRNIQNKEGKSPLNLARSEEVRRWVAPPIEFGKLISAL
jgi:ankyrin repeat protein